MNRAQRLEWESAKLSAWSVWDIKNRWLRAVVAWLFALIYALVIFAICIVGVVWFALVGAISRPVEELRAALSDPGWREVGRWFWLAGTGQDAPCEDSA